MAESDHFVDITPGPYCELVGREDGLPRIRISISGRQESSRLAEEAIETLREHFAKTTPACKLVIRRTA